MKVFAWFIYGISFCAMLWNVFDCVSGRLWGELFWTLISMTWLVIASINKFIADLYT